MVRMVMLYYTPEGDEYFNEEQYHSHYVPGAIKVAAKYNCRGMVLGRTLANREGEPGGTAFYRTTEIAFDTLDDAVKFVFSPERTALSDEAKLHPNNKTRHEIFYVEDETYVFGADGTVTSWNGPWTDYVMERVRQ